MRLPNGFGSVYKLSGKRRRPFIARKTIGWTDDKKQDYITIGYFEKKQEALEALIEYNKNPYDLEAKQITFSEIYELFKKETIEKLGDSSARGYSAAYKACKPLYDVKFTDIKASHLQITVDGCEKSHESKRKIKVLFKGMFAYAMKNDIVSKNYAEFVDIGKSTKTIDRKPFTIPEIKKLWEIEPEIEMVDTILILIYTGFRIGELLELRNENIDFESNTMKGGLKTEAGKDRIVPMHEKIIPLVKKRYNENNDFFIINHKGQQMKYRNYTDENFKPIMEQFGMDHLTHDCRHTWFTLMDNAGANKVAVKKIGGHASYQTSEKVYTHKDIDDLKQAIALIDC